MKTFDLSNIHFDEGDLETYFNYKADRYLLIIDFDEEGYLSFSPYSAECIYLNPIFGKVMKCLFQNEKIKERRKID